MSSFLEGKIVLCKLYETVSARGNRYLAGRLGSGRIIVLRGQPTPAGLSTWDVFLAPDKPQVTSGDREPSTAPTKSSRTRVQRWAKPKADTQPNDRPFHDDPIDDIGRGS
jgi:hypothetical protein